MARVVEAVHVATEGIADLVASCPSVPPDQFGLEDFEEGLDGSVVVTVAFATHRYLEAHLLFGWSAWLAVAFCKLRDFIYDG